MNVRPLLFVLGLLCASPTMAQKTDGGKTLPTPKLTGNSLFYIQRNKNTNTIVYDARLGKDGKLDADDPVEAYWLGYEENSGKREDLSFFERVSVYGVDAEAVKGKKDEYVLQLKAFKDRTVTLARNKAGKMAGNMRIGGKDAKLSRIYIQTDESKFPPKVLFVELFGEDLITGQKIYERLKP